MAKLIVTDALWSLVEPLIPKHTPSRRGGQPPKDDRPEALGLAGHLPGERPGRDEDHQEEPGLGPSPAGSSRQRLRRRTPPRSCRRSCRSVPDSRSASWRGLLVMFWVMGWQIIADHPVGPRRPHPHRLETP